MGVMCPGFFNSHHHHIFESKWGEELSGRLKGEHTPAAGNGGGRQSLNKLFCCPDDCIVLDSLIHFPSCIVVFNGTRENNWLHLLCLYFKRKSTGLHLSRTQQPKPEDRASGQAPALGKGSQQIVLNSSSAEEMGSKLGGHKMSFSPYCLQCL